MGDDEKIIDLSKKNMEEEDRNYKLEDLVDIELFQALQDKLDKVYNFPSAIIDNDGKVLTASSWQDLCTKFHRQNPQSELECIKSDKYILSHMDEADPAVSYRCPHGMIDNAVPIIIDGKHIANFFTGQLFLEPPNIDFFKEQAKKYGFDEKEYLEAVSKVPIWSQEKLDKYLDFIKEFTEILAEIGLKHLREIDHLKIITKQKNRMHKTLDSIEALIYLADMDTYELIYINNYGREVFGDCIGQKCYKVLQEDQNEPCDFCTNDKLINNEKRILDPYTWEFQNTKNGKWYYIIDRAIEWIDGRIVRMEIATDISERKLAEGSLTSLGRIIEDSINEIYIFDAVSLRFVNMNRGARENLGYSQEEILSMTPLDIKPGFTAERFAELVEPLRTGEKDSINFSTRHLRKGGSTYPVEVYLQISTYKGKSSFIAIILDITERKLAEKAINEQNEFLNSVMDSLTHPFYVINADTYVIENSNPAAKKKGINEGDLCYKASHGFDSPCKGDDPCLIDEIKRTKKSAMVEHIHRDNKGGEQNFEIHGYPIFDEDDNVVRIVEYNLDITDRVRAQKALVKSEERLRTVFEANMDAIVAVDQDGKVIMFNTSAELLFQYSSDEVVGKQLSILLRDEVNEEHQIRVDKFLEVGVGRCGHIGKRSEKPFKRKDGTVFNAEVAMSGGRSNGTRLIVTAIHDITERKRMEENLRESEEKYRNLFERDSDAIFIYDPDTFSILDANEATSLLYGYDMDELIGKSCLEFSVEVEESKSTADEIQEKGQIAVPYRLHKKKDGTIFPVEIDGYVITMGGKDVMFAVSKDITERKNAEYALVESEERYHNFFDNANMGVGIVNSEGKITDVNLEMCSIYGYNREEMIGMKAMKLVHPDYHAEFLKFMDQIEEGEPFSTQTIDVKKDGSKILVEIRGTSTMINGEPHMISMVRDVSEFKKAETALKESEELFSKSFSASPNLMILLDLETGKRVEFNNAHETITGYKREEYIGQSILDDNMFKDVSLFKKGIGVLLETGSIKNYEMWIVRKDGEERLVSYSAELVEIQGKKMAVISGIDITEREKMVNRIQRRNEELEKFNELAVDREVKMMELKIEVNSLLERLGEEKRYKTLGMSNDGEND